MKQTSASTSSSSSSLSLSSPFFREAATVPAGLDAGGTVAVLSWVSGDTSAGWGRTAAVVWAFPVPFPALPRPRCDLPDAPPRGFPGVRPPPPPPPPPRPFPRPLALPSPRPRPAPEEPAGGGSAPDEVIIRGERPCDAGWNVESDAMILCSGRCCTAVEVVSSAVVVVVVVVVVCWLNSTSVEVEMGDDFQF